jgi:hypothetical protein
MASESESQDSGNVIFAANLAQEILPQVACDNDLAQMEQQLQKALKVIHELREDGLLERLDRGFKEFACTSVNFHDSSRLFVFVRGILSELVRMSVEVRVHVSLHIINHLSRSALASLLMRGLCESCACEHLDAAAELLCNLWSTMQSPHSMLRFRKLFMEESSCFEFCLQSLHFVRELCLVLPVSHRMYKDIRVCEHILSTAVASINIRGCSTAPILNALRIGFHAEMERSCAEVSQLSRAYFGRLVLGTPAHLSIIEIENILAQCGFRILERMAMHTISCYLTLPNLWESQVPQSCGFALMLVLLKSFPLRSFHYAGKNRGIARAESSIWSRICASVFPRLCLRG